MESQGAQVHDARKGSNRHKGAHMTHPNPTQVRNTEPSAAPDPTPTGDLAAPRSAVQPLRFAVSLTDPQGREVFRKQFASQDQADEFATATAELCPEYKVSFVDRIDGIAWERHGASVSITASPNPEHETTSKETFAA